ncbi:MAG: hypothetical protein IPM66_12580 [Acidobacteriota bacterium]|nr:MAG: hypothetical protein IPM66_12580 [Acidobacteriota bacterium]
MPRLKAGDENAEFIRFALAGIDAEIRELQEKRAELLKRTPKAAAEAPAAAPAAKKRRGRKPGPKKAAGKAAKKAAKKVAKTAAKKVTKKSAKKSPKAPAKVTRGKREVSPETRERLSAAAKARWANARAAKGA